MAYLVGKVHRFVGGARHSGPALALQMIQLFCQIDHLVLHITERSRNGQNAVDAVVCHETPSRLESRPKDGQRGSWEGEITCGELRRGIERGGQAACFAGAPGLML